MSEAKIVKNDTNVNDFIAGIGHPTRKKDSEILLELFTYITDVTPSMWGDAIVGFDEYHYKYKSGREGNWFITGFSPRKQRMVVYIMDEFDRYEELLSQLGKHKAGTSCLYINKLADIDIDVLSQLIGESVGYMRRKYHN